MENILKTLAQVLNEGLPEDQAEAMTQLAQILDTSYGDEASRLCGILRSSGAVASIVALVDNPDPGLHQTALLLIGNIASEAVDERADLTKDLLGQLGAFQGLLLHLFSEDWLTLVYALGAVQVPGATVVPVEARAPDTLCPTPPDTAPSPPMLRCAPHHVMR